jgi:diamine N-acetyltransferase
MPGLILEEVTRDNWQATLALGVSPDQQHFVADTAPIAAIALAKAYIRPGGLVWVPYALSWDATMVGFAELAYHPDSADDYWMFHFFIDQRFQRRGLGKQAMQQFLHLVRDRHPRAQALQLTVHPDNIPAQRLYLQAGFAPTGEVRFDELVFRRALEARDRS